MSSKYKYIIVKRLKNCCEMNKKKIDYSRNKKTCQFCGKTFAKKSNIVLDTSNSFIR